MCKFLVICAYLSIGLFQAGSAKNIEAYFHDTHLVIVWRQINDEKCEVYVLDVSMLEFMATYAKVDNFDPETVPRVDLFGYSHKFKHVFYRPSSCYNVTINCLTGDEQHYRVYNITFMSDPSIPKVEVINGDCNNVTGSQKSNRFENDTVSMTDNKNLVIFGCIASFTICVLVLITALQNLRTRKEACEPAGESLEPGINDSRVPLC